MRRTATRAALVFVAASIALALLTTALEPLPGYRAQTTVDARGFDAYFAERLRASASEGVSAGNEERWLRLSARSPLALLYIHGFGASRADGEYVVERLATALLDNTYFMRLPGHGSRMQDLEHHAFDEYLRAGETALHMVAQLGERRVVIATSLGGALATYLAAAHPDKIAGLVFVSPFYDFVGIGKLLNLPLGVRLARLIDGDFRNTEQPPAISARVHPDYPKHWYTRQYTSSLRVVRDLKRVVARREFLARVRCPVLLFYDPLDDVADPEAMHSAFAAFTHHPLSREVPVHYGNHILASAYLDTDKALILREAQKFLEALQ